jgi:hypothetical protein
MWLWAEIYAELLFTAELDGLFLTYDKYSYRLMYRPITYTVYCV